MLTVLSVGYPPNPVSRDSCGGAEQILSQLDAAIASTGHRSVVVACEGSSVAGKLVPVPRRSGVLDAAALDECRSLHREAIGLALQEHGVDIVHMHGFDFLHYLPPGNTPVLATLHCPPEWYEADAPAPARPNVWLNPVSEQQARKLGNGDRLLAPIENGVCVEAFAGVHDKRGFVLVLGRIAPEKGVHIALDAARAAGVPAIVAGELHEYPEHRRYFDEEVAPRLDESRRWIGPVAFAVKRRLLAEARCVLVCSTVEETSSLTAREALAAGTPVVAFARGALIGTIENGRTGYLATDASGLARAILRADEIDPAECRRVAKSRFNGRAMAAQYLQLYERLIARARAGQQGGGS